MLRITEKKVGEKTKALYLEGKIYQVYSQELLMAVTRGMDSGERVILDFAKVNFLDDEAPRMIRQFKDKRLSLRNCSLFIRIALKMAGEG